MGYEPSLHAYICAACRKAFMMCIPEFAFGADLKVIELVCIATSSLC